MCKLILLLYRLVPSHRFRGRLLRTHIEACAVCGLGLEIEAGTAAAAAPPDWIRREGSMWPEVQKRLDEARPAVPSRQPAPGAPLFPRFAFASGGILTVAALCLLLWTLSPAPSPVTVGPFQGPPRVEVLSAEVEGRKARASIYQTAGASFIWFSWDSSNGGGQ